VHALAKAGIHAHSGTNASPASHLAAGKIVELRPGTS
jgi:hypothetical protein